MFDSHCHLDAPVFQRDLGAVLERARKAGVQGCIIAGYREERWALQRDIAARNPDVFYAPGLHPWAAVELGAQGVDAQLAALSDWLSAPAGEQPVAVGEMGLHRGGRFASETLPLQERAFRAQLALARERELPVILHVVGAHGRALELLSGDGLPSSGGVVHSFSGSREVAERFVSLGLHISFSGRATWPAARRIHEAVRAVPLERLLVETDSPDQMPDGTAGERNEPAYLVRVVETVAQLRGVMPEHIASATARNSECLFRLDTWEGIAPKEPTRGSPQEKAL